MTNKTTFQQLYDTIKSLFVSGFFALLPLAITFAIFAFLYRTAKTWCSPVFYILPSFLTNIPGVELFIVLLFIIGMGAVLKFFVIKPLIEILEGAFKKLPLVGQVYFGIKQLLGAFSPKDKNHFQRVVLVEFPRRGTFSLGFLTNELHSELSPKDANGNVTTTYFNVFVPHTPNPTTGFFIIVPEQECHEIPLTRQEAMTIIISGGIIQPDRFKKAE
ncbi:MAG: hypothetical protein UV38_C0001G0118 [candidate division TM6 bacterium GW2011_GWE2_42_60]|nr:MAG: hypothetical protein UV38_C0001G0118 [candidate division TM6 bacterium GW2011_GWE2_42_60]HBY05685.1 hypothetical protein [Candidatus Dependentiae bacterium]